jgi:hypothetical protein
MVNPTGKPSWPLRGQNPIASDRMIAMTEAASRIPSSAGFITCKCNRSRRMVNPSGKPSWPLRGQNPIASDRMIAMTEAASRIPSTGRFHHHL